MSRKESRMQQVKGVVARSNGAPVEVVTINAVDIDAKKLETAKRMGATHTVDSSALDPVAAIEAICAQTHEGAEGAYVAEAGR
jgi:S-(hydroxymethyl)mycothiol dehydrogenase